MHASFQLLQLHISKTLMICASTGAIIFMYVFLTVSSAEDLERNILKVFVHESNNSSGGCGCEC